MTSAPLAEHRGTPRHFPTTSFDLRDRAIQHLTFTVHDWLRSKRRTADIQSRGKTLIIVGGTHLYAKALPRRSFDGPVLIPSSSASNLPPSVSPHSAQNQERDRVARCLLPSYANATNACTISPPRSSLHLTGKLTQRPPDAVDSAEAPSAGKETGRVTVPRRPSPPPAPPRNLETFDTSTPRFLLVGPRLAQRTRSTRAPMPACANDGRRFRRGSRTHVSNAFAPTANPQAVKCSATSSFAHIERRVLLDEAVERIKIDTSFRQSVRTWLKRLRTVTDALFIAVADADPKWRQIGAKLGAEVRPFSGE